MNDHYSGYEAGQAGEPVTVCPFRPGEPDWKVWQRGWTHGRHAAETASGAMSARTERMKAEAAAAIVAEGRLGAVVDPAEEILGYPLEYSAEEAKVFLDTGHRPVIDRPGEPEPETWPMAMFQVRQVPPLGAWMPTIQAPRGGITYYVALHTSPPPAPFSALQQYAEQLAKVAQAFGVAVQVLAPVMQQVANAFSGWQQRAWNTWLGHHAVVSDEEVERRLRAEYRKVVHVTPELIADAAEDAVRRAYWFGRASNPLGGPDVCPRHGQRNGGLCRKCQR